MRKILASTTKMPVIKENTSAGSEPLLHQQAFYNSLLPHIISTVSTGQIIIVNAAACKLLRYSKKELLTKTRSLIFDITESNFKKMLKQRTAEGRATALVTALQKKGRRIPCEITSSVFLDDKGIKKAITTIADISQSILKQKDIDTRKEKIVADNIGIALSKQKNIDGKKEKIVAVNIALAKSKQKDIDAENKKTVTDNIGIAKSKQKDIDVKNEKIVAENIALVKSKQKDIDAKNKKIVAENIVLAQARSDARLAENNEWIKYIAQASYDVMWDWNVATGEIYVGDSMQEVFGYKVLNNTVNFTAFDGCLLPEEKERVMPDLFEALSSGSKTWADSFMFRRRDGSLAASTSRASIIRDDNGKAIRLIGAIQDISRLQDLEKKLEDQTSMQEEQRDKFQLAIRLSVDIIWDWNLLTGEVFISEGFTEVFGHQIQNNKADMAYWSKYIHSDDREAVEKKLQEAIASSATYWEQPYRFIRADGSVVNVFGRGNIMRHANGKAFRIIGAMQDLSLLKELEEKLDREIAANAKQSTEYKEGFKLIFNSSSDVLYDIDLATNEVIISDGYEKEFGYKITADMTPTEIFSNHIHPDDKEALIADYFRMIKSTDMAWKYNFRFIKEDQSEANILGSNIVMRKTGGRAYRMIGSMTDTSKQKVLEEKLAGEIRLKEKQIAEAMEDAKNTERSDIGKELHDNVNQLLGASNLYLDMAKRGGEFSEMYLSRSSEYSRKAIEEIRKLTKGLTTDTIKNLGLCEAIENMVRDTMEVNPIKISVAMESSLENRVHDKFKLNVFRIVQEQLNNILKHAKATGVTISIVQNMKSIILSISDNGIGFDPSLKRNGIGLKNITSRALSFKGSADFVSQPGHGCVLNVIFPVSGILVV